MGRKRSTSTVLLIACAILLLTGMHGPSHAAEPRHAILIMEKLPPPESAAYKAIRKRAGSAKSQRLALTKAEMWQVPANKVGAIKKAATAHGAHVSELGPDWNRILSPGAADPPMTDKQKSMMDHAKASKSTTGVGVVETPGAALVEHALTRDHNAKGAHDPVKIKVALNARTVLTIARTSVSVKPDMCVWRGAVEGTGAPATLMWWPSGKMTGTVHHEGRVYSIKHIGGDMHVVVETSEERMPHDHAPMPPHKHHDSHPHGDPLVEKGEAEAMRPKRGPRDD